MVFFIETPLFVLHIYYHSRTMIRGNFMSSLPAISQTFAIIKDIYIYIYIYKVEKLRLFKLDLVILKLKE